MLAEAAGAAAGHLPVVIWMPRGWALHCGDARLVARYAASRASRARAANLPLSFAMRAALAGVQRGVSARQPESCERALLWARRCVRQRRVVRGSVKLACVHGRCWVAAVGVVGLRAQAWPAGPAGRVRQGDVQCRHGTGAPFLYKRIELVIGKKTKFEHQAAFKWVHK